MITLKNIFICFCCKRFIYQKISENFRFIKANEMKEITSKAVTFFKILMFWKIFSFDQKKKKSDIKFSKYQSLKKIFVDGIKRLSKFKISMFT